MYHARRVLLLVLLAAAGATACNNSNSTGPSAAGGATITGSLVADRAMSGVTVNVSGTSLGSLVTGNRFTIRDVPGGNVRLQFRGPSLDGAIDLQNVRASETIELTVRVSGSTVALEGQHRRNDDDDDDDEVEFQGVLTSKTGIAPALVLIVGGRTVRTNAATAVRDSGRTVTFDALVVGQTLEVEGAPQADGSVLAKKLQIEDDDDDEDEVEFTGTLTSRTGLVPNLTLVVGGRTVLTNTATEIRTRHGGDRLDFTAIVVGTTLEVKGDRQADASIVARRLRVGR